MIGDDARVHFGAVHVASKAFDIETERGGVSFKDGACVGIIRPTFLVAEEPVVHLPELALLPGGFGRVRRDERVLVCARQRELAKDEMQLVAVVRSDLLHFGIEVATRRTLIIAKLFERERRICAPRRVATSIPK